MSSQLGHHVTVGLLMMLLGPITLGLGVILGGETGAILIMLGLIASIWFGIIGYRVIRGGTSVGELPGYFLAAVIALVGAAICSARSA